MNKACFLPLVLATAVASVASADTYTNVFTGVSSVTEQGVPTAVGASWTTTGVNLTKVGNAVAFEAEGETMLQLGITSDPQDTNTIFRVSINGTIEEVADLIAPAAAVQTAFAICTNAFHAWNGSAWVVLDEVPANFDGSVPTNLVVEIKYQGTARKVCFKIGDAMLLKPRGSENAWVDLGGTALSKGNISGFGAKGSGTLAAVNGDVMLGIAEYDGVKYGTLAEAVSVAAADTSKTVAVLRPTSESITLENNVKIADGGNVEGTITVPEGKSVDVLPTKEEFTDQTLAGKSGEYTIPVKVNGGTVNVVLPSDMSNKEITGFSHDGTTVKVTIRTTADVITNAAPGGKALAASETKLRDFLDANLKEAYEAADVSSSSIATALSANGANNIPLYQSYVLGIEPDDPVKPVTVPNDIEPDGITLAIPAINTANYSGDYAIKYKVGTETAQNNPGAIKVPLATGSYSVNIVFE